MEEQFPEIPDEIDCVFDLAGSISNHSLSISSALQQSDLVIVPIYNEIKCLTAGVHTINEVSKFTKNIIVVGTKLAKRRGEFFKDWVDSNDCKNIQSVINNSVEFEVKVFPLKISTAFERIFEDEKSIHQLIKDNPLLKLSYKEVAIQFENIFKAIKGYKNAK